jgi:hypothetical protein
MVPRTRLAIASMGRSLLVLQFPHVCLTLHLRDANDSKVPTFLKERQ